ncbi:uncharacterized protein V1518DRAFT_417197 [Limtongia smithiae]|uniref:uncharacterized protein n=1 Tax=Limtongia smithiae TaxID=1125753 RepID=UPI0034CE7308
MVSISGSPMGLMLHVLLVLGSLVAGVSRIVMSSSSLGMSAAWATDPQPAARTRMRFTTRAITSAYFSAVSGNTLAASIPEEIELQLQHQQQLHSRSHKVTETSASDSPLIFDVENLSINITLAGGYTNLGITKSLDQFSELTLVSPSEFEESKYGFQQYGGLIIPYKPTLMAFHDCTVRILNSDQSLKNINSSTPTDIEFVTSVPSTELAELFELISKAITMIPPKYRCMILNSEKFSPWDTVMLAWRMRRTRDRFTGYLRDIEQIMKLAPPSQTGLPTFSGLLLLSKKDFEFKLDGSTLDLQRAVVATRDMRALCT